MARIRFTILGCGSSGGVPRLGGLWGACDPTNLKNRRRRCSLLIERFAGAEPEALVAANAHTCNACGASVEFDDLPDRYFMFLGSAS